MDLGFSDEEKADLEARAEQAEIGLPEFIKILALTTAYGRFYPAVRAFWDRAMAGISGPRNKSH